MKKKKNYLPYLILTMSILLLGCDSNETQLNPDMDDDIENVMISGSYPFHDNEEALFEYADLVVIGKTNQSFMDREHVIEYMESYHDNLDKAIGDYYTRTSVIIDKVLKQPESEDFKSKSELTIIEPISIITYDDGTRQKLIAEDYQEIEKDQSYLLYLVENVYGEYTITNSFNGRYNLDQKEQMKYTHLHNHSSDQVDSLDKELKDIHVKILDSAKQRIKETK